MSYIEFIGAEEFGLRQMSERIERTGVIDPVLYTKYEVKKGLRGIDGRGVLAGLTEIGDVRSYIIEDGEMVPTPGKLFYRGIEINDIVNGFLDEERYGFEEASYLLLFGCLPNKTELESFCRLLSGNRNLPNDFVRDIIMKAPSSDIMNGLARSILTLYSFDRNPDDTSIENVLRQCIQLIASFPLLAVYSYQTFSHYFSGNSLVIHSPRSDIGTAQNILHLLKPDNAFFEQEAKLLDLALVLHAEHGGGNNSTFVTHVVTSSGTDTYSAMAASLGSLKGPRHGGANLKVVQMIEDIKANVSDWSSDVELSGYMAKMLDKQAFDGSGLIYGFGHAVYSISDPRTEVLKHQAMQLAHLKNMTEELQLYLNIERLAPLVIGEKRKIYKGVSANVDFYSGFVYQMLEIPLELFTPLFASARIVGWSAHRIEEIVNNGKIIRPAYKSIAEKKKYVRLDERCLN